MDKIKIAIDARTLDVKGGSRTYAKNFLYEFKNKKSAILFGPKKFENFNCHPIKSNQKNPLLKIFWEIFILPHLINKYHVNIFHGLKGFVPPFTYCRTVVTINDLASFVYPETNKFPDNFYWRYLIPFYIKRADHIIAISEATKRDLVKFLGIDPKKITTIHLAYSKKFFFIKNREGCYKKVDNLFKQKNINMKNLKQKKIILSVNTIQPRKNIVGLIKAFENIAGENEQVLLFLVGKWGWKYEEIKKTHAFSKYKNRIIFLGFVPDEILADLYNISFLLAYPSFYEGFGLPILEAQACGCPVITSDISSMPEIAGKGAIIINPYDINQITKAIEELINNKRLRDKLIKEGHKNIKRFSWKKTASETMEIYKMLSQ